MAEAHRSCHPPSTLNQSHHSPQKNPTPITKPKSGGQRTQSPKMASQYMSVEFTEPLSKRSRATER